MSTEEQITYLESRLEDNPKSLVFARLADLYLDQNRVDEAIQLCIAGIKHNPSYVTGNYVLAKAYILSEDYENAESALKQVISHDREFLTAHKLLGDLMRKLGWGNKAAAHYRDIIQIDPLEEKIRSLLESLNESVVEESNDQPDSEQAEESIDNPTEVDSEVSDWMNEIKEVFPDEIKPEPAKFQPDASVSEEFVQTTELESEPDSTFETESLETLSDLELDEPEAPADDKIDSIIEPQLEPEDPVVSETPKFFAIKGEDEDDKDLPVEKIAAEFLAPEQVSEPPYNEVGEEVVSDEVEIFEIRDPLKNEKPVEPDNISTENVQPEQILDADSTLNKDEDGSDFAQALDSLEAMESETGFDEGNETTINSEAVKPASDLQDEPLIHEDSGLEPLDSSEIGLSETENHAQESATLSESAESESFFEWDIPGETEHKENISEPEFENEVKSLPKEKIPLKDDPLIKEEPDVFENKGPDVPQEKIPQIQMTPAEDDETESFTLDDLDLDIKAEPDQTPVENLRAKGTEVKPSESKPGTEKKPLKSKIAAAPPPVESEAPQPGVKESNEPENDPEEENKPSGTGQKSTPRIVTPTLGEIYSAQGQYDKALVVFEELLQQNPDDQRYKDKVAELKHNLENPL